MKQPLRIWRIQRFLPFVVRAINFLASKRELLARPVVIPIESTTTNTSIMGAAGAAAAAAAGGQPPPPPPKAVSVACSAALTVVLSEDGRVYCMGYNRWGQCGQGSDNVFTIFEPLRVGGQVLDDERVTSLAVGFQQVLVLCESGRVYGWGKSLRGQLGIGEQMIELPVPVDLPGKVIELRSGFSHAVAVLEDGDVYVWGRMQSTDVKAEGRVPVFHDQLYPRKVDVGGGRVVEAFCSSFNTLLRMEDGRMMMFGLEADTRRNVQVPVEVDLPPTRRWSFFGGFNDIIFKSEEAGGLLKVSFTSKGASVSPFRLPGIDQDRHVESVSVGWQHTVALVK
ncbi:unnamed protein product [Ascophyllum nodosum]